MGGRIVAGVEIDVVVTDCIEALKLYQSVFDLDHIGATAYSQGLNEAMFSMYGTHFHMLDENPEAHLIAPKPGDPKPMWINVIVPDIRETYGKAIAAGCEEIQEPINMEPLGVTNAMFSDVYGYIWMLHEIHREISFEERCRIMEQQQIESKR
jgi:uncharacterized glyoxalase superfamily protein PhnB